MENKFTAMQLHIAEDSLKHHVKWWWYWTAFGMTISGADAEDKLEVIRICGRHDLKIKEIQRKFGDRVKLPEGFDSRMKEIAEIKWDVKF